MVNNHLPNINIDEPLYDQSNYIGRALHFFQTTNPLNIFYSDKELERAASIVKKYRNKEPVPECQNAKELYKAKILYESAYHPDTGEKMFILGRMSAQVPMNMIITGGMMTFYKTTAAVVFWQWLNQSFNAVVNYTNRSGKTPISERQLLTSYAMATGGAMATALGLNSLVKHSPPLIGRLVPFAAVAAANCINIPMMRSLEIQEGIPVCDSDNNVYGNSKIAAVTGITAVTLSRIFMATPGMVMTPVIMNQLEKKGILAKYPRAVLPIQIGIVGLFLTFATPLCCALFKQRATIYTDKVETHIQENVKKTGKTVTILYYNKGL